MNLALILLKTEPAHPLFDAVHIRRNNIVLINSTHTKGIPLTLSDYRGYSAGNFGPATFGKPPQTLEEACFNGIKWQ